MSKGGRKKKERNDNNNNKKKKIRNKNYQSHALHWFKTRDKKGNIKHSRVMRRTEEKA